MQEVAEKNIEMLKALPETSKAYGIFEEIIIRDVEKIRNEGLKKKDPSSIVISIAFLTVAYSLRAFAAHLWNLGGWSIIFSLAIWCTAAITTLLGLVGILQGLGWMWNNEKGRVIPTHNVHGSTQKAFNI